MLPDRSKRYASVDGDLPRLRLAENWQLAVIALIMGSLFMVIFPRKALVEKLYNQERLDELTLSYIENLHRTDPANADLSILLVRAQQDKLDVAAIEKLIMPVIAAGDARQRAEARILLLDAYERALKVVAIGEPRTRLSSSMVSLLEAARRDEISPQLAGAFAASAFRIEQPEMGLEFLKRIGSGQSPEVLVRYAREALGAGRHGLAAEYFLLARQQVKDRDAARALFKEGIGALMAASRFQQAMQAADRNLGDLAEDQPTLRFMMRSALAAGDPKRAAYYARRLVLNEGPVVVGAHR